MRAARNKIRMEDGPAVFREAVVGMSTASEELLEKAGVSPSQVDWIIAHQRPNTARDAEWYLNQVAPAFGR